MKSLLLALTILLSACAQLMHGQEQPVIQKSAKEKIYFTTCSGTVEDWGACNNKAQRTCVNGYMVVNKFESAYASRRELTFQCK